jgi:membrane-associated phospholipid phosphatase
MSLFRRDWARLTSDILCPPVVWGLLSLPVAFRFADSAGQALIWAAVYITLVCVIPALYIVWMVKRGRITDIHMRLRRERFGPFLVSLVGAALSWGVLQLIDASPAMPMMTAFTLAQLAVMTLITLVWQISMHAMSISGAMVTMGIVFGPLPALAVAPLIPLVGTARLRLERHTPAQVIAGTLVGAIMTITLFALA